MPRSARRTQPRPGKLTEVAGLKKLLAGPPHFLGVVSSTKVLHPGSPGILMRYLSAHAVNKFLHPECLRSFRISDVETTGEKILKTTTVGALAACT